MIGFLEAWDNDYVIKMAFDHLILGFGQSKRYVSVKFIDYG